MAISIELLKKWMEEARSNRFMNSSNIPEAAAASGNYNVHLSWVRDKILLILGIKGKPQFEQAMFNAASLIEMGVGNCGPMSIYLL
jgi:hypothetical protein